MNVTGQRGHFGLRRLWMGLLLCALLVASLPLQSHRADCHLKTRSDCPACVAGSTTAQVESRQAIENCPLRPLGTVECAVPARQHATSPLRLSGRAPPASLP